MTGGSAICAHPAIAKKTTAMMPIMIALFAFITASAD
jgi:hypothetical protein